MTEQRSGSDKKTAPTARKQPERRDVRINRAAELLLTTDQTVTYIAMEVGYANVKTFNRNFLRFKVMTPGDFRKKVALQESRLYRCGRCSPRAGRSCGSR